MKTSGVFSPDGSEASITKNLHSPQWKTPSTTNRGMQNFFCCGPHSACAIVELKDHVGRSRPTATAEKFARSTGQTIWALGILDGGRLPLSHRTFGPQGL